MEQWLILSNVINYVKYNGDPRYYFISDIKALEEKNDRKMYDRLQEKDWQVIMLDFGGYFK